VQVVIVIWPRVKSVILDTNFFFLEEGTFFSGCVDLWQDSKMISEEQLYCV
jgi:hypothetical protein